MFTIQPRTVIRKQKPVLSKKRSHRPSFYINPRTNQIIPRPVFTCIDETYAPVHSVLTPTTIPTYTYGPSSPIPFQPTVIPMYSLNDKDDESSNGKQKLRTYLLVFSIVVIIFCVIAIIVLLSVFLTR